METRLKRFLSLALALLMVFSMMPQITLGASAASTTTLYCVAPDSWTKCNVYYWGGSSQPQWPGKAMTKGSDGIWSYEVPSNSTNVIFNNGSAQTADLTMPKDDKVQYNYLAGTWSTYGAATETPTIEYVTVYCNASWSTANAYWWGSAIENPGWPGNAMAKDEDGLWSYAIPEDATGLIFNNGSGTQTADLTPPTGTNVQFDVSAKTWGPYTPVVEEEVIPVVTLNGTFNNWSGVNMTVNGSVATYTMELEAGTYEFKVIEDGTWMGNGGTIEDTTEKTSAGKGWEFKSSDGSNCKLTATGGTYTFSYDVSTNFLIITHQAPAVEPECEHTSHDQDGKCTECGESVEHTAGAAATCCTAQTCTVCGKELAPATGEHTYEDGCTETKPVVNYVAYIGEQGFATFMEALNYAIENGSSEIKVLSSVREVMPTDVEILLKADLTITADQAVEVKFYNNGTKYDFIINSDTSVGNFTFTIDENVTFQLEDRIIWAGYYGNNIDVIVKGTLAGWQYWHGADTKVTSTGTLKSTGEAMVLRRGATLTVDGGTVNANYFSILAGNIDADNATITSGSIWVSNTGSYDNEGGVLIDLNDSTWTSTGNIKLASEKTAEIKLTNSSLSATGTEHGPSVVDANSTITVGAGSALNMKKLTGEGTLTIEAAAGETPVAGNVSDFTGSIEVTGDVEAKVDENGNIVLVERVPEGTITYAFTDATSFWGEGKSNSKESFVVELYEGDKKIASATLKAYGDVQFDGDVYATWSIPFDGTDSNYWTVEWAEGYPNINMAPTAVKLIADGKEVATNNVQWNGPDNVNKIVALAEDKDGKFLGAYTNLADAMGNFNDRKVNVLCDVTVNMAEMHGVNLTTNVEGGVTITNTFDGYIYACDLVIGEGVTVKANKNFFFESNSVNTVEGTLEVAETFYHGYDGTTTIKNGGKVKVGGTTILRYNKNADAGIYVYGDGDDSTVEFDCDYYIGAYSGTFYAKDATIETGYFLLKNSYDSSDYADIDMTLDNSSLTVVGTTDTQDSFIIDDQARLTLKNGSAIKDVRDFNILSGANLDLTVDESSSISATYVNIAKDVPFTFEKNEDGTITLVPKTFEKDETNKVATIYNVDGLKAFRDEVNNGNKFKGWTVNLVDDIDLNSEEWTPIGTSSKPFDGIFNGNNHVISNLVITGNKSDVGLFGRTNDGEIKNLTINNAKVSGYLDVGVVVGTPYTSKYTNIKVTGHVEVNGFAYVGGVGGKNAYADWTNITVNVDSESYVKASSNNYRTYVGGVIGFNGEGAHTFKNITSNINVIGSTCDVGGIFGIIHYSNIIENVSCSASVTNTGTDGETGGIAGVWHNQAGTTVTVNNASFTGTVTSNGVDVTEKCGVVGAAYNASNETPSTSGSLIIDGEEAWLAVAKIGEEKFATLQAAIDAVEEGQTITLVDNVNVTTPAYGQNALNISRAVNFTIDLNGKTLSADTGNSVVRFNITGSDATSNVTVTVKNGTVAAGSNTWCALMAAGISTDVKAVMNLEDLTVTGGKAGDLLVKAWDNGLINAKNVTINALNCVGGFYAVGGEIVLDNCTVTQKGLHTAPYLSTAFAVSGGGKLTVNSGTYSSEPTAASEGYNQGSSHGCWLGNVMNSGGTLIINGGTFSNGNYGDDSLATNPRGLICIDAGAKLEINGGTFNALGAAVEVINNLGDASKNPTAEIYGGNFVVGGDTLFSGYPTGLLYVYGGTYSAPVAQEFCATGYVPTEISEGVYGVKAAVEAKIGKKSYATLAEAVAAAKEGDTILLQADVIVDEVLVINHNITIADYGTFSITCIGDGAFRITGSNNLNLDKVIVTAPVYADSNTAGATIGNAVAITGTSEHKSKVVSDGETVTVTNPKWIADVNGTVYYLTIDEAIKAAVAGDIVNIYAGEYKQSITVDKAITVVGETDENGNNLVKLIGGISITADGATVKNLTASNPATSGYNHSLSINAKDVLVEGCEITDRNGVRYGYTSGTVTFKDSIITGTVYGIHFDGNAGGKIVIDNCVITGWTSFAGTIEKVSMKDTTFAEGSQNYIRFYQDADLENCTFNDKMKVDISVSGATVNVTNPTFNGKIENLFYASDIDASDIIVDGTRLITPEASINGVEYDTFAEAIAAAKDGNEVKVVMAGTYKVPTGKNITITGAVDGVVFDNIGACGMDGASVTFNNVTFDYLPNTLYTGLQHSGNMVYNNCTINGTVFLYGTSETFNNCTFNVEGDAYNVWTYGAKKVAFNECTFNSDGKSVLIYSEQKDLVNDVTITKSTFKASAAVDGKAAIEMDSSLTAGINLTIDGETTATGFGSGNVSGNSLWNNKKGNNTDANNDITVVVGTETALAPVVFVAKIGQIGYTTLEAAIAAVENTGTIELVADAEISKTLTIGSNSYSEKKDITINGNGHTIKAVGEGWTNKMHMVDIAWNVTLNNVTFDGNNTGCRGVQFYTSSSTLNNVTVKNISADLWSWTDYAIHANASDLTVTGTLTFENCKYGNLHLDIGSNLPEGTVSVVDTASATLKGAKIVLEGANTSATAKRLHVRYAAAELNGTYYGVLADAIALAQVDDQLVLMADAEKIELTKSINLDVNGKTVGEFVLTAADVILTAEEGLNVTTAVEDHKVVYANGVYSVERKPNADITYGIYDVETTGEAGTESYRERMAVDLYNVYAKESLVVELWSGETKLSTTTLRESDRDDATVKFYPYSGDITANIVIAGRLAGSWDTEWLVAPSVYSLPDSIKVYADGELVATWNGGFMNEEEAENFGQLPTVEKPFKLAGANVMLGDSLKMYFYVNYADLVGEDYYAEIRRTFADGTADEVIKVPYSKWEHYNSEMIRVSYNGLSAKAMTDELYVTIYNADDTVASQTWEDSIKAYAMRQLSNTSSAKLKTVLVDLLNYGAAAQAEFGNYGINDLANADLTAEQKAYATQSVTLVDNRVMGTNYAGSSISLKSSIVLTMYFQNLTSELYANPSVDDMYAIVTYTDHYGKKEELRVEGEDFFARGIMHGVDITGLAVADGKQLVTCVIYNADGNEIAHAADSIESYIARMANTADPIYEMVMKFVTSAIAYFGNTH